MLPLSAILREGATPESLEYALSELSEAERSAFDNALKTLQGSAQTALPGVVQGASSGAALGPWGALIGGVAGGATSLLSAGGRPQARPRPVRPSPPRPSPQAPPLPAAASPATQPQGPAPAAAPSGGPLGTNPAAQLLMAVQDPRTLQALASLVAGSAGREQVPLGQTSAAPAAFLTMLGTLAAQAAANAPSTGDDPHAYMRAEDGEYAWDVANPEARARALLSHLQRGARGPSPSAGTSPGDWLVNSGLAEVIPTFH